MLMSSRWIQEMSLSHVTILLDPVDFRGLYKAIFECVKRNNVHLTGVIHNCGLVLEVTRRRGSVGWLKRPQFFFIKKHVIHGEHHPYEATLKNNSVSGRASG